MNGAGREESTFRDLDLSYEVKIQLVIERREQDHKKGEGNKRGVTEKKRKKKNVHFYLVHTLPWIYCSFR